MSTKSQDDVWPGLPDRARQTMHFLGHYRPTVHAANAEVKGLILDEECFTTKCYLNAKELRDMAADLIAVADWLTDRAAKAEGRAS